MKLLVTGATGHLGSHVAALARARGDEVRALVRKSSDRRHLESIGVETREGDVLDEVSLRRACKDVECVVHCAIRPGYWSRIDDEQRRVNVEGTSALLRAARAQHVRRLVHVSSVAAVGATRDGRVLDEGATWNGFELGIGYVHTKRESEERVFAAAWGGDPVLVVNPGMILGPRLDGRATSSLVAQSAAGRVRRVPEGGTSVTDAEDCARAILQALDTGRIGERYILGGHDLSWKELHERIARIAGHGRSIGVIPSGVSRLLARGAGLLDRFGLARPPRTPEIYRTHGWYTYVDSGKAERELGYRVRPLEEILARSGAMPTRLEHARS